MATSYILLRFLDKKWNSCAGDLSLMWDLKEFGSDPGGMGTELPAASKHSLEWSFAKVGGGMLHNTGWESTGRSLHCEKRAAACAAMLA